jgi:hypothetical protein
MSPSKYCRRNSAAIPSGCAGLSRRRARLPLSHPNVVVVYDVGSAAGISYVVTELLEGDTLRAWLRKGPIKTEKAVELVKQILSGLAATHARSIVHRDLKPDPVAMVMLYAGLDDLDAVEHQLQLIIQDHGPFASVGILIRPSVDKLATEPRFQDLFRRIHLPF